MSSRPLSAATISDIRDSRKTLAGSVSASTLQTLHPKSHRLLKTHLFPHFVVSRGLIIDRHNEIFNLQHMRRKPPPVSHDPGLGATL